MPIQSFTIVNVKIISKAICDSLPKLMIIAGRNGIGKSTLLYELRKFSGAVKGTGKILYSAPHRTWRRRNIRTTWLWGQATEYSQVLTQDSIPGFEGIGFQDASRRPDTTDEAPGIIKYVLAQIETKRKDAIVSVVDKNDLRYPEGSAPDVYKPLKEMLVVLLPHLQFLGIDQSNRDNVKCLLRAEGVKDPIDIDDLSSGEKEVIALFMPLLERQINYIIRRMQKGQDVDLDSAPDTIMILDEPDLHIHPELQRRMLSYMRKRAYEDNIQFIIATHSPIIINEAASDELFSLMPKDVAPDGNQLHKVLSNQEKLGLFKDVCGDVAILTLGRPIVFIEGKTPEEMKNAPSDQRLLELLCSEAKDFTFVPMGGKKEVSKAAELLNQLITERLVGLPVYAIVDSDLDIGPSTGIEKWECCAIENVLLDPLSMYEVLEPYREKTSIADKDVLERELLTICQDFIPGEINRRLRAAIPPFHLQFGGETVEQLEQERNAGLEELKKRFANKEDVASQIQRLTKEVREMVVNKTALVKFDGKSILRRFHQKFVSGARIGMSFEVFCYSIAERIGSNNRTPETIKNTLISIRERLKAHSASSKI